MASLRAIAGGCAALLLLAGCSFDGMWPSLTGDDPAGGGSPPVMISASEAEKNVQPVYSDTASAAADTAHLEVAYEPDAQLRAASPTGTYVGSKVAQQRAELDNLKSSVLNRQAQYENVRNTARQNAQSYFATVAAITARLQVGTTPGNPVLVSHWNAAQSELDRILTDIAALNTLGNQVAADVCLPARFGDGHIRAAGCG